MHVGLNLVFLVPGETGGMEVYARELIGRLARMDGLRLTAFLSREAAAARGEPWGELPAEVLPVRATNRLEWVRGEQQHLPGAADARGCEIVHSLASTAPLRGRAVRVTTIHDLNYKLVPDTHFGLRGLGMRVLVPAAARRSHRLIAISQSTRRDLVEHLRIAPAKIDVVPQGAAAPPQGAAAPPQGPAEHRPGAATPPGSVKPAGPLRERLGLGERPVVLSASAKRPHKNLARALDALAAIPPERRPVLVVPGYPTPYEAELRAHAEAAGVAGDVVWPAWLPEADLEGLYAIARLVLFPSLYEGFGLPVLEAMARGVPVACSNRASLPEVAGDAALQFDPEDTSAMAAAVERLLGDAGLRAELVRRGHAQAARFTWERTAELTVAAYERALSQRA